MLREAKGILEEQDEVGSGVGVSRHFRARVDVDEVKFASTRSKFVVIIARLPRSSLRRWSGAVVEWVCINWKDTAMKAIY